MPVVWAADARNILEEAFGEYPDQGYMRLRSTSLLFENRHNSSKWYVASSCNGAYRPRQSIYADLWVTISGKTEYVVTIFNIK